MFCGNCGSKAVEGDRFCVTCGQAPRPASESVAVLVQENPGLSQPYQSAPGPPFSGKATAAFVLSLLWLGGIGSFVAIFLASSAVTEIKRGTRSGRGLAVTALILSICGSMAPFVIYIVLSHNLSSQLSHVSDCLNTPTAAGCP
jgi:hypothetical protein